MNPSIRACRTTQDERNDMKKFFLILCFSAASINAMDERLQVTNQTDPNIDHRSLGNDILNVHGNQGIIEINSQPEDTLFGLMRAVSIKAREDQKIEQQKTERLRNIALGVGCSGLVVMLWPALQNIFLSTK